MNIPKTLSQLDGLCSAGYAIALHVRYTAPKFLFQTYPADWMEIYSQKGLVLKDPTVLWGFENTGTARWGELVNQDEGGVLEIASRFGLKHGFSAAVNRGEARSIASFARSDNDFSDAEIVEISDIFGELHDYFSEIEEISAAEQAKLKEMSIAFTRG